VGAIIKFQCWHLAVGIAFEMLGLAVFPATQIDGLLGHLDALLGHEHADYPRVRPDRVVKLHGVLPYRCRQDALSRPSSRLSNRQCREVGSDKRAPAIS